jgi:membrane fusion protein, multidrug efflux system
MKLYARRLAWCVTLIAALACSCSRSDRSEHAPKPDKSRVVKVVQAEERPLERSFVATGSLAAQDHATLSIKVPGRLHTLAVDLGSVVEKGDLLAQVEPQDYELRRRQAAGALAQARAALGLGLDGTNDTVEVEKTSLVKQANAVLDEASKNRNRIVNLAQSGISSQSEVDTVEAAYTVALNRYESALEEARTRQATLAQRRAELDLAQKQLSDTSLYAPFNGAIQARLAGLGEFIQTGTPVVTLVRTDPLRLRLEVPERYAAGVRLGQHVRVRVEGSTNAVAAKIARLSPALSEQSRMLLIEADVPNDDAALRPGQFVRGEIITNERESGLVVPASALIIFAGLEKVVTIKEGKALEKTVSTGRRSADWVEVVMGLKAGERVVLDPGTLRSGQSVVVTEPPPRSLGKTVETSGQ